MFELSFDEQWPFCLRPPVWTGSASLDNGCRLVVTYYRLWGSFPNPLRKFIHRSKHCCLLVCVRSHTLRWHLASRDSTPNNVVSLEYVVQCTPMPTTQTTYDIQYCAWGIVSPCTIFCGAPMSEFIFILLRCNLSYNVVVRLMQYFRLDPAPW